MPAVSLHVFVVLACGIVAAARRRTVEGSDDVVSLQTDVQVLHMNPKHVSEDEMDMKVPLKNGHETNASAFAIASNHGVARHLVKTVSLDDNIDTCPEFFSGHCGIDVSHMTTYQDVRESFTRCCIDVGYGGMTCDTLGAEIFNNHDGGVVDRDEHVCQKLERLGKVHAQWKPSREEAMRLMQRRATSGFAENHFMQTETLDQSTQGKCFRKENVGTLCEFADKSQCIDPKFMLFRGKKLVQIPGVCGLATNVQLKTLAPSKANKTARHSNLL
jgi:hypothetical protein